MKPPAEQQFVAADVCERSEMKDTKLPTIVEEPVIVSVSLLDKIETENNSEENIFEEEIATPNSLNNSIDATTIHEMKNILGNLSMNSTRLALNSYSEEMLGFCTNCEEFEELLRNSASLLKQKDMEIERNNILLKDNKKFREALEKFREALEEERRKNEVIKNQAQLDGKVVKSLRGMVKERSNTIERADAEKLEIENAIERLKEELSVSKAHIEELRVKIHDKEEKNITLNKANRELKEKLQVASENVSELYGCLRKKEEQIEVLVEEKEDTKQIVSAMQQDNEHLRNKFTKLKNLERFDIEVSPAENTALNIFRTEFKNFQEYVVQQFSSLNKKHPVAPAAKSEDIRKPSVDNSLVQKESNTTERKKKKISEQSSKDDKRRKPLLNDDNLLYMQANVMDDNESTDESSEDEHLMNPSKRKTVYPVKNSKLIPLVPGKELYSEKVSSGNKNHPETQTSDTIAKRKLLIMSTSITKGIDEQRFDVCYGYGKGSARIQKWPGGRVRHMKHYVGSHLEEDQPNVVIIQAGGNDLSTNAGKSIPIIANDIMEMGIQSKNAGAADVFIGGVTIRGRANLKPSWHELNKQLKSLCIQHNFNFIDNSDITPEHLYDGVHLNKDGTRMLADNYLDALREKFNQPIIPRTGYPRW